MENALFQDEEQIFWKTLAFIVPKMDACDLKKLPNKLLKNWNSAIVERWLLLRFMKQDIMANWAVEFSVFPEFYTKDFQNCPIAIVVWGKEIC